MTNSEGQDNYRLESESSALVFLSAEIYSNDAILRAAYWFTSVAFVQILPRSSSGALTVQIRLKQTNPTLENPNPPKIESVIGEFCNSLLDFELRRQVEAETAGVRQLILAKAFSESGVLEDEPPGPVADPVEEQHPGTLTQILNASDQ